jgi:hypothetical protein
MRWFVEVSSVGKGAEKHGYCVDADSWQKALQATRTLRNDPGAMTGFSIELLDDGFSAVDPVKRQRYSIRKAPADAVLSTDAAGTLVVPIASPSKPPPGRSSRPPAPELNLSPKPHGKGKGKTPPPPQVEVVQKAVVTPGLEVLAKREQDPGTETPLTYREYAYFVDGTPDRAETERLLRDELGRVRRTLASAATGQLVNLAIFNVRFSGRPSAPPLAALTWKDWKGDAVVKFADDVAARVAPKPVAAAAPTREPVPEPAPNPATIPAPAAPPPASVPPAPPPAPVVEPAPPPSPVTEPSPPPPPASEPPAATPDPGTAPFILRPSETPYPGTAPFILRPSETPDPGTAPFILRPSEPPDPGTAPFILRPSEPPDPGTAPFILRPGAVEASVIVALPSEPAPVPVAPAAPAATAAPSVPPASLPPESFAPPTTRAPESGFPMPASVSARPGPLLSEPPKPRLRGDELIADLFEAMHDLQFLRDSIEGADFCLTLALEKMPAHGGILHLYDIDHREFVITCAGGPGGETLLSKRYAENDPILAVAMRKRRALVLADASASMDAQLTDRYVALGGAKSVVVAPVEIAGRFLGAIELLNPIDEVPFTDDDGHALSYIAEQLAGFVAARGISLVKEVAVPVPVPPPSARPSKRPSKVPGRAR